MKALCLEMSPRLEQILACFVCFTLNPEQKQNKFAKSILFSYSYHDTNLRKSPAAVKVDRPLAM